jgi:hypothetical protein
MSNMVIRSARHRLAPGWPDPDWGVRRRVPAAANELENSVAFSRGREEEKSFCGAKRKPSLRLENFLAGALELKTGFSKSVRRRAP